MIAYWSYWVKDKSAINIQTYTTQLNNKIDISPAATSPKLKTEWCHWMKDKKRVFLKLLLCFIPPKLPLKVIWMWSAKKETVFEAVKTESKTGK